MKIWQGSAGLCINTQGQILMVLQGKPDEKKLWTIPSGGKEIHETFEECCIREIREETGYEARVVQPLHLKKGTTFGIDVEVQYFEVEVISGKPQIQDPDNLIYEISWKTAEEITELELSFPEDRAVLIDFINRNLQTTNQKVETL